MQDDAITASMHGFSERLMVDARARLDEILTTAHAMADRASRAAAIGVCDAVVLEWCRQPIDTHELAVGGRMTMPDVRTLLRHNAFAKVSKIDAQLRAYIERQMTKDREDLH